MNRVFLVLGFLALFSSVALAQPISVFDEAQFHQIVIFHNGKLVNLLVPNDLPTSELESYVDRALKLLDFRLSPQAAQPFFALNTSEYDAFGTKSGYGATIEHYLSFEDSRDLSLGENQLRIQVDWYAETFGNTRSDLFGPGLIYGPCTDKVNEFRLYVDNQLVSNFGSGIPLDDRFGFPPSSYVGGDSFNFDISNLPTGQHVVRSTFVLKTIPSQECLDLGQTYRNEEWEIASGEFTVLNTALQPPVCNPPMVLDPSTGLCVVPTGGGGIFAGTPPNSLLWIGGAIAAFGLIFLVLGVRR